MVRIATSLVAFLAMVPGAQEPVRFTDPVLGLQFDHPSDWGTEKKSRDGSRFSIPLPDTTEKAELEILRAPFHSSKEIWQTIQLRVNETSKKTVVRQWEQDVLSVPMLFTLVSWTDKGVEKNTLSGLFFSRTPTKLLFKLTAPTGEFPKAQYQLDQILQSLSTTDGKVPLVDDENIKLDIPKKQTNAPLKPRVIDGGQTKEKAKGARVEIPLTVSTKPVRLVLPDGWQTESTDDARVILRHPELSNPLTIEVHYLLDSDPPLNALFKLSSSTLNDFTAVTKREDTNDQPNDAGCRVTTVWRVGKSSAGDLFAYEATGLHGDFYFIFSYRSTSASTSNAERRRIRTLLDDIDLIAGGA